MTNTFTRRFGWNGLLARHPRFSLRLLAAAPRSVQYQRCITIDRRDRAKARYFTLVFPSRCVHYINIRAFCACKRRYTGLSADKRELLRIRAGHAGAVCDILRFPSLCPVPLGPPSPSFSYRSTFPDHLGNGLLEKSQTCNYYARVVTE